jgi:hypothetical protein
MLLQPASKTRPFHLGPFPLETLPRDDRIAALEAERSPIPSASAARADALLARVAQHYEAIYAEFIEGECAAGKAPVPDDLQRRMVDAKGVAYFMDASQVGICQLPERAWLVDTETLAHDHAVGILVEHQALPDPSNLARAWVASAVGEMARLRALEIATCLAGHLRHMGMDASVHLEGIGSLDIERVAVLSGLAVRREEGLVNP